MPVLRFISSLLLLIAVIALVADATRPIIGAGPFTPTPLGKHIGDFAPATLQAAKASISRATAPWVWESVVANLLRVPTFVLFGALGVIAGYAGRHRRRVNVFIN